MSDGARTAIDRDLDRVLKHLELTVTRRLDGLLRGSFASASTGPGTDPDSAREYVVGDDVRRMDWSVTARTGVAHVRDPEAERELESWIVAESSPRLTTGSGPVTKRHLLAAATAAITSEECQAYLKKYGSSSYWGPTDKRQDPSYYVSPKARNLNIFGK